MTSEQNLLASLPFRDNDLAVRAWSREDVDRRAAWPPYPAPYSDFTSRLIGLDEAQRDDYFRTRNDDRTRITLTADLLLDSCIAHIVLREADWQKGVVGNMGFRVHPERCDRGLGTRILKLGILAVSCG